MQKRTSEILLALLWIPLSVFVLLMLVDPPKNNKAIEYEHRPCPTRVSVDQATLARTRVPQENSDEAQAPAQPPPYVPSPRDLSPELFPLNKDAFMQSYGELGATEEDWDKPGVQDAFKAIQEYRTLANFLLEYETRELARWVDHKPSIPLETELGPCLDWLEKESADPIKTRTLIDEYSRAAAIRIQRSAEQSNQLDDEPSRWALFEHLGTVPRFQQAAQFLEKELE